MNTALYYSCHTSFETTLLKCDFAFALFTIHQRFTSHVSPNDVQKTKQYKTKQKKHILTFESQIICFS